MLGEIDCDAGFAEAGGDQLQLPRKRRDVAGGEYAGDVRLHHRVDLDRSALDFQPPLLDRPKGIVESDVDEQRVDPEGLLFFTTIVIYRRAFDPIVPPYPLQLVKREDFGGTSAHEFDALLVGAEAVAAVDEGAGCGDGRNRVGPIDRAIPPADDQDAPVSQRLEVLDEVVQPATGKSLGLGEGKRLGLEGPDSRGDQDGTGSMIGGLRM